jgi:hypothetical protein
MQNTSLTFVVEGSRARLNSLPSDLVCIYMPYVDKSKAYDRSKEKKIPNRVGARTQPCFIPLLTGKEVEEDPSYLTVS